MKINIHSTPLVSNHERIVSMLFVMRIDLGVSSSGNMPHGSMSVQGRKSELRISHTVITSNKMAEDCLTMAPVFSHTEQLRAIKGCDIGPQSVEKFCDISFD